MTVNSEGEEVIGVGETPLWFIAYDCESENVKGLEPKEADWLRSQRVAIWYALRYKYKCVPIQNSLWLIREAKTKSDLETEKNQWLEDYKRKEFRALIEIFPIQTNDVGYATFRQWEFDFILEWLGKIQKSLINARDKGTLGKKSNQANTKKLQLLGNILNEDFDPTYPDWKLAQDMLVNVKNELHKAQYGI